MSCCPPGSEPYLASNYAAKGEKKSITGVEFYSAGTPAEGKKAILIIPDIWGWDSGTISAFCHHTLVAGLGTDGGSAVAQVARAPSQTCWLKRATTLQVWSGPPAVLRSVP
eukprot:2522190-Rhodomonas_salina.1